jgi:hypothetical protein
MELQNYKCKLLASILHFNTHETTQHIEFSQHHTTAKVVQNHSLHILPANDQPATDVITPQSDSVHDGATATLFFIHKKLLPDTVFGGYCFPDV